jgi:GGDEF domain-containing protein
MHKQRHQGTVCFLIGPDQDRQDFHRFFEQSGFQTQIFKNPAVLFDYLQEFKPFVVVLDTSSLRSKLSHWVSQLHSIRPGQAWMALAPMSQYSILATYQNRGLVEIVDSSAPFLKERTLWALDRELNQHLLSMRPQLDFIESAKKTNPVVSKKDQEMDLSALILLRTRESEVNHRNFTLAVISIDDLKEISEFWGSEIKNQTLDFLYLLSQEKWGVQNVIRVNEEICVLINKNTKKVLHDIQELQKEIQTQGKTKFGFLMSVSGGVSEYGVHTSQSEELIRLSQGGYRKMQSKGGGRVAVPKPLSEERHGDLPQNMG